MEETQNPASNLTSCYTTRIVSNEHVDASAIVTAWGNKGTADNTIMYHS